jgi:hypothetical protein
MSFGNEACIAWDEKHLCRIGMLLVKAALANPREDWEPIYNAQKPFVKMCGAWFFGTKYISNGRAFGKVCPRRWYTARPVGGTRLPHGQQEIG